MAALARLGTGEAASAAEAAGTVEVERTVDPSVTADEAAERMALFQAAVDRTLARP